MSDPIMFDEKGNFVFKINPWKLLKVLVVLGLAIGAGFLPITGLTDGSRICLMIFVGAAGLWISEAIPPFATAIMVLVLNVFLLGRPGGPLDLGVSGLDDSYQIFLVPMASPILALFFGGLILAQGATKHGLDVRLARALIKPFGDRPTMVLLGVILTTALFSMFMSNTATTAMMIAIFAPLFRQLEGRNNFQKALVLSIPFAANIGGMGTIIGTPPNAIAASVLQELGYPISFFRWMVVAMPIVIVLLIILWLMLVWLCNPRRERFEILFPDPVDVTWDLVIVVATFTVTVLLWLTSPLHGIPSEVVALIPVMIFTMFGIIDRNDIKSLDWDVLILVAGGMTLGVAMERSGLSALLQNQILAMGLSEAALLVAIAVFALLISNFMSHTAASSLIIPVAASLAVVSPVTGAMTVALTSSLAMSLPISTPPNAIAFATRVIKTRDMARYGTLFSVIGITLLLLWLRMILK